MISLRGTPNISLIILTTTMLFVGWMTYQQLSNNLQRNNWHTVEGAVVESFLNRGARGGGYNPLITYQYSVDGKLYVNDQYSLGVFHWSESEARRIVERHTPGMRVTVHYDPTDPERSALTKKGSRLGLFLIVLATWGIALICIRELIRRF